MWGVESSRVLSRFWLFPLVADPLPLGPAPRPRRGNHQPGDGASGRRLAGAVAADDDAHLTDPDGDRHPVECRRPSDADGDRFQAPAVHDAYAPPPRWASPAPRNPRNRATESVKASAPRTASSPRGTRRESNGAPRTITPR